MSAGRVIVVGSVNADLTAQVSRHPAPGETVLGSGLRTGVGGKGANQALAAARAGAEVALVAAIGFDAHGDQALAELEAGGVDVSAVLRVPSPTGIALITVDSAGENSIVVEAGANANLSAQTVAASLQASSGRNTVLAQLEVPLDVVLAAAQAAEMHQGRFVLNPSPTRSLPIGLLALADPVVVNEGEAETLTDWPIEGVEDALTAVRRLATRSRSAVVTLGKDGAVWAEGLQSGHVPGRAVRVVDTTGAGDVFAGTLAARLNAGTGLLQAVTESVAAAGEAVTWHGAQPVPTT